MNSVKFQDTKSTKKSVAFLYTSNNLSEREIKKTIAFLIASKRLKYLGTNLHKEQKTYTLKTIIH